MSLKQEVVDIITEQLGVDKSQIEDSVSFVEDLNADSLDLTELIMTFEERFDCEIPDGDAEKIRTVGDAVKYIEANVSAKN